MCAEQNIHSYVTDKSQIFFICGTNIASHCMFNLGFVVVNYLYDSMTIRGYNYICFVLIRIPLVNK